MGAVGGFSGEGSEEFQGGGVVVLVEGLVSPLEGILFLGLGRVVSVVPAELGLGGDSHEQECGKDRDQDRQR